MYIKKNKTRWHIIVAERLDIAISRRFPLGNELELLSFTAA